MKVDADSTAIAPLLFSFRFRRGGFARLWASLGALAGRGSATAKAQAPIHTQRFRSDFGSALAKYTAEVAEACGRHCLKTSALQTVLPLRVFAAC